MKGNRAHFIFLATFCFPAQPVLYCWQPWKLIWNKWTWSTLPKGNSAATEYLFSFILAAQIPSAGDLLVTDPLLLPLSYLKPIVQAHNSCLCAFSLLPILNSRSPVLSLQYVQCKWQDGEWWWMFETGGGLAAINLPEASPDCEDVRGNGEAADTWRASQSLSSRVGSHPPYQQALSANSRANQPHNTSHSLSLTAFWQCSPFTPIMCDQVITHCPGPSTKEVCC